ncbi:hypothetical protein APHAL10511_000708 [Amanita phalloides]|nr:hypothetical protein APHAL10511_000708 [Amanita phalloides]
MSLLDALKPHRAEALQRVRTNAFCLAVAVILSYLLPLPTIPSAFNHALFIGTRSSSVVGFLSGGGTRVISTGPTLPLRWSLDAAYTWVCTIEAAAVTIFLFNISQGIFALKYPPSTTPASSPARTKTLKSKPTPTSTPNRHPFRLSSPKTTTPQKPFTFSPTQSQSQGPTGVRLGQSSVYPCTPADTPSRGSLHYTLNLGGTPNRTLLSSGSSVGSSTSGTAFPASPTPVIAAWRGRHVVGEIGKPLDGSFLGQLLVGCQDAELEGSDRVD